MGFVSFFGAPSGCMYIICLVLLNALKQLTNVRYITENIKFYSYGENDSKLFGKLTMLSRLLPGSKNKLTRDSCLFSALSSYSGRNLSSFDFLLSNTVPVVQPLTKGTPKTKSDSVHDLCRARFDPKNTTRINTTQRHLGCTSSTQPVKLFETKFDRSEDVWLSHLLEVTYHNQNSLDFRKGITKNSCLETTSQNRGTSKLCLRLAAHSC